MIELNEQQRYELKQDEPLAHDPETGQTYVLVRKDVYERIKGLVEDSEWAEAAYRSAMEVFARDGWDDPRMDVYDALDPRKPS